MKRINGYRIIDDFQKINDLTINHLSGYFCVGWYTDGFTKYLFKNEDTLMSYRELFYSIILKKLNMSVVENDLAKREKQTGIISKDYKTDKLSIKSISKIINDYDEHCDLKEWPYYVNGLKKALLWYCKTEELLFDEQTEKELIERFIIQILLGNSDLNSRNLEIYTDNSTLRFSPFYDFGAYGTVNPKNKENGYKFQYKASEEDEIPACVTLEDFFNDASRKEIEFLKEYLEKVQEIKIFEVFNTIKEQTEYAVPEGVQIVLKKELKENLENVHSYFQERKII